MQIKTMISNKSKNRNGDRKSKGKSKRERNHQFIYTTEQTVSQTVCRRSWAMAQDWCIERANGREHRPEQPGQEPHSGQQQNNGKENYVFDWIHIKCQIFHWVMPSVYMVSYLNCMRTVWRSFILYRRKFKLGKVICPVGYCWNMAKLGLKAFYFESLCTISSALSGRIQATITWK